MLKVNKLRNLTFDSGERPYLAAASGLVRVGDCLYVIADDEVCLGIFPAYGDGPGKRFQLVDEKLPEDVALRKAAKPDLEVLTHLPATVWPPYGALLALGSGSTPARRRGVLVPLAIEDKPGSPRTIDLGPLYARVARELPNLNIEGAAVTGDTLRLLQRGNGRVGGNASVDLDLHAFVTYLERATPPSEALVRNIRSHDLGALAGVRFTFTDASPLPDGRLVFSAVAEDTPDTYSDGPCLGAAIGLLDADGTVAFVEPLDLVFKVEGVHATVEGFYASLQLVADGDDPEHAAPLLAATLRLGRT